MGEKAKLDAMDLVINVLREHERSLDQLVEHLETLVQSLQEILTEIRALKSTAETEGKEALTIRIRELEGQIEVRRGRESARTEALNGLYPIEQSTEINSTAK